MVESYDSRRKFSILRRVRSRGLPDAARTPYCPPSIKSEMENLIVFYFYYTQKKHFVNSEFRLYLWFNSNQRITNGVRYEFVIRYSVIKFMDLPPQYDPKQVEARIYAEWLRRGFFAPPKSYKLKAKSYTILLPPPNITGSLHMGHALNATISDILIRYHRMKGYKTTWLPGIDHAGIATQNVVEKQLRKDNISRFDLGREKFVEKIWEWKTKYGGIILDQLKRIGASCDWSRTRFTMDPEYSLAVQNAFIHYYKKGLIYRGKRIVNWCTRCQTSLSDLEIEYKEEAGKLYFIKYPLVARPKTEVESRESEKRSDRTPVIEHPSFIVVATTRPETMLGDAGIAVNPKDKRYKHLVGKLVRLPLVGRDIPIVADASIDMKFGTGMVKVTPAHDMTDAEIGARHKLPVYEIINERGRMTDAVPEMYRGLKVTEAREKVVADLEAAGFIEKIENYAHNIAQCYRCGATLEPLLSNQWFLRMASPAQNQKAESRKQKASLSLRDMVLKTLQNGDTKILPKNFQKVMEVWLENIRDWCISRQIWWGHRLPVWFHEPKCVPKQGHEGDIVKCEEMIVAATEPKCEFCDAKFIQSEDVLDTWFSSALWPFAGLGDADLKQFYPSSVLITARDIINLWVGRMIFSGLEFMGKTPFPDVLIHGTILTKEGKRMSKSLGTGIDPLQYIDQYGADATRFGIIWQCMGNQDIRWDEAAVMAGRKFANKIWNAGRFVLGRMASAKSKIPNPDIPNPKPKTDADKRILKKLVATKKSLEKRIAKYELGAALHILYDFFWHDFCDVYLETSKTQQDANTDSILSSVLTESLKMLHPFMPHITEEIFQKLPKSSEQWLMREHW